MKPMLDPNRDLKGATPETLDEQLTWDRAARSTGTKGDWIYDGK